MSTPTPSSAWSLEVIRGREVGRVYAVNLGEIMVGNALNGTPGLDLADQEGSSPRRMAARHAILTSTTNEIAIQDLDSPGGTFVNRQRLLSSQPRRLEPGDVIQLGSVQLRVQRKAAVPSAAPIPPRKAHEVKRAPVVATSAMASPPVATPPRPAARTPPNAPATAHPSPGPSPAGRLPLPFSTAGGISCRTWDDFLVLSAQHWRALRDELSSGRLAEYLGRIQRLDLVPRRQKDRSADDQLDEWLARLPATASSAPELDVHPESLIIHAVAGGGITHQAVRVTNVGYRLLRCTARVEPAGTPWVRLRPEHNGRPFSTIDQTDLPIELDLPETIDRPLISQIVIESNGGTKRIAVRIERPAEQVVVPESATRASIFAIPRLGHHLSRMLAGLRPGARIVLGCVGAMALRAMVVVINLLTTGGQGAWQVQARLSSVAILMVGAGVLVGAWLASRRGEWRDLPAAGFAGGSLGLLAAAVGFAVIQSAERVLGAWSRSFGAVVLLWGATGALLALVSTVWVPYQSKDPETAR
jgi:FHA domain